jgi:hypothetical protein
MEILIQHPTLYDVLEPDDLPDVYAAPYLTRWINRNRAMVRADLNNEYQSQRQSHDPLSFMNKRNRGGTSQKSKTNFVKGLPTIEQYGSSSVPTLRQRGRVSTSIGKRKNLLRNGDITLYHVITKKHNAFAPGDIMHSSGKTWWHSDPGFYWQGRHNSGRTGPLAVLKMRVARSSLAGHRSTKNHDTNLGTTFVMNGLKALITNKRKMNTKDIDEFTIVPIKKH